MARLDLSNASVLLVDDVHFSRVTVARMLKDLGNPTIHQADDGRQAFDHLRHGDEVDFIVSDFNMPVMDGLQLLKAVRTAEGGIDRAIPFAMLTGYSDKHLVDLALALDVNAFLIKPASKNTIAGRIDRMLSQVGTDHWLKPIADYAAVDVDKALEAIVPGEFVESRQIARSVFIQKSDTPLFKADTASPPRDGTARGRTGKGLKGRRCGLDKVPENSVLARNVHTADGRLFLAAGARLTPRVLSVFADLEKLGHPVENIWVTT